jgi:hypothetical protein
MKHLKHVSKTLAKTHGKHLRTIVKHTQHPDKNTCNMCVKYMQHPNKHTCNIRLDKTDEILEKEACNIRVQPFQHIQHPGPNLQHLYKTLATYL